MTRDLPANMIEDLITPNIAGTWMWLCEFVVPNYTTKRYARNTEEITYGGENYPAFNFEVGKQVLTGDGSIPRITLRISQDAHKVMEKIINDTQGGLGSTVKIIKVNSEYLGTAIPALEVNYDLLLAESDSEWLTFVLGIPNPLSQRVPLRIYSSDSCPWATPTLFKGPRCRYVGAEPSCTGTIKDCRDNKDNAVNWGGEIGLDPNTGQI